MENETLNPASQVEYVKSHAQSDIEMNKGRGVDASLSAGWILRRFLYYSDNLKAIIDFAIFGIPSCVDEIRDRTGKDLVFWELPKCGYPIHELYSRGYVEELESIRKYSKDLIDGRS